MMIMGAIGAFIGATFHIELCFGSKGSSSNPFNSDFFSERKKF